MEYYYLISGKCFRTKFKIDNQTLNTESKYKEWKSKLKRVDVKADDLLSLEKDLWLSNKILKPTDPIDFTNYIMQK